MRYLEILQKFSGKFTIDSEETVTSVCLDEYGHLLFVYTLNHVLLVFKYQNDCPSVDLKMIVKEEFPMEDGVFCGTMDYI
jgi:hypothetical protein